jgi:hypothetical protein
MKKYAIRVLSLLFINGSLAASVFVIENRLDDEVLIVLQLNKIIGNKNMNIELLSGAKRKIDTRLYGVKNMQVFVGSRNTGRRVYNLMPPIPMENPLIVNGFVKFFQNIARDKCFEFKYGKYSGEGLLVPH